MGPRHDYRESLILRRLRRAAPGGRHPQRRRRRRQPHGVARSAAGYRVTSVDTSEPFLNAAARGVGRARRGRVGRPHQAPLRGRRVSTGSSAARCSSTSPTTIAALRELRARARAQAACSWRSRPRQPVALRLVRQVGRAHPALHARRDWRLVCAEAGFDDADVDGWGFPVTGLYHRQAYVRIVRAAAAHARSGGRRGRAPELEGAARDACLPRAARARHAIHRAGTPGYFGLLASAARACRPAPPAADEHQLGERERRAARRQRCAIATPPGRLRPSASANAPSRTPRPEGNTNASIEMTNESRNDRPT